MPKALKLGAPSLTGKDANALVAEHFKDAVYPLKLKFTNLIGMALSFPEVSGLFMKPIGHHGEESVVVSIKDEPALQRLASSIEQIAELNGKAELLEVDVYDEAAEVIAVQDESVGEVAAEVVELGEVDTSAKPGKKK